MILLLLIIGIYELYWSSSNAPECKLMEGKTTLIESLNTLLYCVLMSIDISNLFRSLKFWWFLLFIAKDCGAISSLCAFKIIFFIIYLIGGIKPITLSQQQLFVMNLVHFLNSRFRTFHLEWLITLEMYLFYLERCYQSKIKR